MPITASDWPLILIAPCLFLLELFALIFLAPNLLTKRMSGNMGADLSDERSTALALIGLGFTGFSIIVATKQPIIYLIPLNIFAVSIFFLLLTMGLQQVASLYVMIPIIQTSSLEFGTLSLILALVVLVNNIVPEATIFFSIGLIVYYIIHILSTILSVIVWRKVGKATSIAGNPAVATTNGGESTPQPKTSTSSTDEDDSFTWSLAFRAFRRNRR
ncbi:hypothetical protein NKF26_12035 [Haladaptatus sp. AB618]|uniref:hypothetical protein n=1 Tax=Haladaptatus sp. AB618 TaxID=2934173 RepID=UPI00209BBFE0|nr:hypothetical protein [Haladaptatus sp. AB618]MCO8254532.1 hypothetical protein [Haladaptatus sp. AB618]